MRIGILELHLDLPGLHSLKEKRGIIKTLLNRVRNDFQVAAAEVAHQDLWQSAGLGFAAIGNDAAALQSRLHKVVNAIEAGGYGVVVDFRIDVIA